MISDSAMDDIDAAILQAGFEVHDFKFIDLEDDEPTATEQHSITDTVTVHRISTDKFITYSAGNLSTWVTEFEIDLHEGKFDQP